MTRVRVSVRKTGFGYKPSVQVTLENGRGYIIRSEFAERLHRRDAIEDGMSRAKDLALESNSTFVATHRNAGIIKAA